MYNQQGGYQQADHPVLFQLACCWRLFHVFYILREGPDELSWVPQVECHYGYHDKFFHDCNLYHGEF